MRNACRCQVGNAQGDGDTAYPALHKRVVVRMSLTPPAGAASLDHTSSAQLQRRRAHLRDHNDRVVIVQPTGPRSGRVVWPYGHTGVHGTGPGYLYDASGVVPAVPALNPAIVAPGYRPAGNGGRP